jgi:hypothetical protein
MAQLQALAREELQARLGPEADLRDMERAAQAIGREMWAGALSAELQQRCAAQPVGQCRACGGRLRRVDAHRPRRLQGVVAPLQYARPYYVCGACGRGVAPSDEALGIGPGAWTPALQAAAACLGVEAPFAEAAAALTEALGMPVPTEGVRRTTEALGMVAEAEEQARIAEVERGQEEPGTAPVDSDTLLVTLDGCAVHADGAWHEAKVGSVSTLGPGRAPGGEKERRPLRLGPQHYCVGVCEDAERFWRRLYALAVAWGLGGRRIRRVVVVADGAPWIWNRVEPFLALSGVEVISIVDLWHARQRIWEVAHAVFGEESAQARAWSQDQKARGDLARQIAHLRERLAQQGVSPVREVSDVASGLFGQEEGLADADGLGAERRDHRHRRHLPRPPDAIRVWLLRGT